MDIEKLKYEAQNKTSHIADVSGSALYLGDCLDIMPKYIEDKSIDLILCDLPYGTTNCSWDSVIDLPKLWIEYERIIKDNGAIILTAQTPFATFIKVCDRIANYEYSKQQGSRMAEMYEKEMSDFVAKLYDAKYEELFNYLTGAVAKV